MQDYLPLSYAGPLKKIKKYIQNVKDNKSTLDKSRLKHEMEFALTTAGGK